jgi:endonuclease YncB( thermonuclease family)
MMTAEIIARLQTRRAALAAQGRTFATPAARATVAHELRALDAQIAAYEGAVARLAELDMLGQRLAAQHALARRLEQDGVDWRTLFAWLRRAALGESPWPACAADILARLRRALDGADADGGVATVARVIDGDGVRLADGREVRYIGIDAPEMYNFFGEREPWAQEATDANARLVAGRQVRLAREVSDTDRHGRLLRHVYVNGTWVNGELVRAGLARILPVPPDVQEAARLAALQQEAQQDRRGMWS